MAFPAKNSAAEQVCNYLLNVGSATAPEIRAATGLSFNTTVRAFECGFLTRMVGGDYKSLYIYSLTPQVRDFLAMGATRYEGEIVKPRVVNVYAGDGMKGYTANLMAGKREPIREDMSFLRASSATMASK